MDQASITAAIRRGIREPRTTDVSTAAIEAVTLRAVLFLGLEVKEVDASFFNKQTSLTSKTHIFDFPSDCLTVLNVWDMLTNAKDITGASNATPIVLTSVNHGFDTDDIVVVHDVAGNTAANGNFRINKSSIVYGTDTSVVAGTDGYDYKCTRAHTSAASNCPLTGDDWTTYWEKIDNTSGGATWAADTDYVAGNPYKCILAHTAAAANRPITGASYATYWEEDTAETGGYAWETGTSYIRSDDYIELEGSTGNAAYTSGGKIYKQPDTWRKIKKINLDGASNNDSTRWYPREKKIVIDNPSFTYDLIVDYEGSPDAITDIPSEYHEFLVSFGVVNLIKIPKPDAPDYYDKLNQRTLHKNMMDMVLAQMRRSLKASAEAYPISQDISYDDFAV